MGGVHGLAQVIENAFSTRKKDTNSLVMRWIKYLVVFLFVAFAWVFFVSNCLPDAAYVIRHFFSGISSPVKYLHDGFVDVGMGKKALAFFMPSFLLLFFFDYVSLRKDVIKELSNKKIAIRWIIYVVLILWIIFMRPIVSSTEFIYFQF